LNELRNGVIIDDNYKTAPAKVRLLKAGSISTVEISIYEGKNRQVRKMFEAVGHRVIRLKRTAFGHVNLGDLKEGQWKHLNEDEIKFLKG